MSSEQYVQKKITDYLKSKGFYTFKVIKANKSGVPDIIACQPGTGRFVAIEVKKPSSKSNVSELQKHNIELINGCNGVAFVATSVEDVRSYFD